MPFALKLLISLLVAYSTTPGVRAAVCTPLTAALICDQNEFCLFGYCLCPIGATCSQVPRLSQPSFDWIVFTDIINPTGTGLHLATINATSPRPLTLTLRGLSTEPQFTSETLGLQIIGNEFVISPRLLLYRYELEKIRGLISITDDRSECPRDIVTFSFEAEVPVSWIEPAAYHSVWNPNSSVHDNHRMCPWTPTFAPGSRFPLGVTEVAYRLDTPVDSSQQPATIVSCTFTVTVKPGVQVITRAITHVFEASSPASPVPILRDYVIDMSGKYEDESSFELPSMSVNARTLAESGLTIGISGTEGKMFTFTALRDHRVNVVVDLLWCAPGAYPHRFAEDQSVPAITTVKLLGLSFVRNGTNDTVIMDEFDVQPIDSATSHLERGGNCLHSTFRGAPIASVSLVFSAVLINFRLNSTQFLPDNDTLFEYAPVRRFGGVYVDYTPETLSAGLTHDTDQRLHVNDIEPPVIEPCPKDIVAHVPLGETSVQVRWIEPKIHDNAGLFDSTATYKSADFFSIFQSPYTINYSATDRSGLTGVCTFRITLVAEHSYFNSTVIIPSKPTHVVEFDHSTPSFVQNQLPSWSADYLFRALPKDSVPWTLSFMNTKPTRINLTLRNSVGHAYAMRKDSSQMLKTCFEVDLRFISLDSNVTSADLPKALTARASVEFVGLKTLREVPISARSFPFPISKDVSFRPGKSMRISVATCTKLPDDFIFEALEIQLTVPENYAQPVRDYTFVIVPYSFVRFAYYNERVSVDQSNLVIFDKEPPVFSNCPGNISVITSPGHNYSMVSWVAPHATDNIEVVQFNASAQPGESFGIDLHKVAYLAQDFYGNSAECVFFIDVADQEPPNLICPDDLYLSLNTSTNTKLLSELRFNASDNSGQAFFSTRPPLASMSSESQGTYAITVVAVDYSNNTAECSFNLIFQDLTAPVFTACPVDVLPQMAASVDTGLVIDWPLPTVVVDGDGHVNVTGSHTPRASLFKVGSTQVTYTAIDSSNNTAYCRFWVNITAPPTTYLSAFNRNINIGVGIGLAILVILVIGFAVAYARARKARRMPHDFAALLATVNDLGDISNARKPREVNRSKVTILDQLGFGNFGAVFKGTLTEMPGYPGYLVAVKTTHDRDESDRDTLLFEAAIMAQFNHRRVVGLIGVVTVGAPLLVVMEYCENGALNKYLQDNDTSDTLKYSFAGDCAEALGYLGSLHFIHRDVAARNVLLDSQLRAKISDFGMSRDTRDRKFYQAHGGQLPVRWTAPEALESMRFTHQSDCWSFGILVYEIWTKAQTPYAEFDTNQKVWTQVLAGYRLACPQNCPRGVYDVMMLCWDKDPSQRPSFPPLVDQFREWQAKSVSPSLALSSPSSEARNASNSVGPQYVQHDRSHHKGQVLSKHLYQSDLVLYDHEPQLPSIEFVESPGITRQDMTVLENCLEQTAIVRPEGCCDEDERSGQVSSCTSSEHTPSITSPLQSPPAESDSPVTSIVVTPPCLSTLPNPCSEGILSSIGEAQHTDFTTC